MPTNNQSATVAETLVDAFIEVDTQDKKSREKESSRRKLRTRRAIEDYMESKRLREAFGDYSFD